MLIVLRNAVIATAISCAVGLLVHLLRPDAIPFFAEEAYELFVPCPVSGGEVAPVPADDPAVLAEDTFLVDARSRGEFESWSVRGATDIPYDYLDPTPREVLEDLAEKIARSRARRVVVYGDGDTPDTGEQLAKEISGHGIRNVFFVKGGAPELKSSEGSGDRR
jgi:hypothetical protein